jgi:hypothetical protein
MNEREPFPEEAENDEPVASGSESVPDELPADVPEADAIEQAAPAAGGITRGPDTIGDAPEADAIEQLTEVAEPDDEYRG